LDSDRLEFARCSPWVGTVLNEAPQSESAVPGDEKFQSLSAPDSAAAAGIPAIDPRLAALDPDRHRPANVIESHDLCLSFGAKRILTDISIPFGRGSITALIGPTGSGKSTFLRSINRMNDKVPGFTRSGDITLDATSIWSGHQDLLTLRRRVGMLFQRPNPFPMSILDNVVAGVKAHRIAKGKQLELVAERRLTEVGLWDAVKDRLNDSPFRLSGGQQQLLCLARALAVGPEVLLLDEPTSSLDPISTESIEALLQEMAPALTLIVVTHNLGQARRVSHNTMFFYDGRLVEFGPTEQLFNAPVHPDTERYVNGRMG
jgi:phosphate transport system ATP-binding protein